MFLLSRPLLPVLVVYCLLIATCGNGDIFALELKPLSDSASDKAETAWQEFRSDSSTLAEVFDFPDSLLSGFYRGEYVVPYCKDTSLEMLGQTYHFVYRLDGQVYCVLRRGNRFVTRNIQLLMDSGMLQIYKKRLIAKGFRINKRGFRRRSISITSTKLLVQPDEPCIKGAFRKAPVVIEIAPIH